MSEGRAGGCLRGGLGGGLRGGPELAILLLLPE